MNTRFLLIGAVATGLALFVWQTISNVEGGLRASEAGRSTTANR